MERVFLNLILVSSYLYCDSAEIYTNEFRNSQNLPVKLNRYPRSDRAKNGLSCALPEHPENGNWFLSTGQGKVGEFIDENDILLFECDKGYKLSPNYPHLVCDNNWNSSTIPKCEISVPKQCPDLDLGDGFNVSCKNSAGDRISCAEATDLSTLSYKCPYGFEIAKDQTSSIRCMNGSWESVPECQKKDSAEVTQKSEEDMKIVCIYNSRKSYANVEPKEFNANLCTHIVYHHAGLSLNGDVVTVDSSSNADGNQSLYEKVLSMKKSNDKLKILLSISGLGINIGDEFPTVAADPIKRARLVTSINHLLEMYKFDGIDIHWRYPVLEAKKNYGALLKDLKDALKPQGKLLTATVYFAPTFLGYNISSMITNLDWVNVKCYGHYDEFSDYTGQNSALYPSSLEKSYEADNYNLKGCSSNWNYYGIGKEKTVVGITFLGRYYTLAQENRHGLHAPVTGSTNSMYTGLVSYSEICQKYTNWTTKWDDEQKNPYKYYKNKWLGYDDPESIKLKAAYLKKNKYSGVAIFSIDADDVRGDCGAKQALLNQIYGVLKD